MPNVETSLVRKKDFYWAINSNKNNKKFRILNHCYSVHCE